MSEPFPLPEVTTVSAPYWEGLARGELRYQRCPACGHRWLPAREDCPRCLRHDPTWEVSAGRGRIVSWVVYHQAFHGAFAARVPYNVAVVELDEGPRLVTNIEAPSERLRIEAPVELRVRDEHGVAVARFALAEAEAARD
jgi:uncharacterized OB-fold protein